MRLGLRLGLAHASTAISRHNAGKELIENLVVLRFSNLVFAPLWNRRGKIPRNTQPTALVVTLPESFL